MKGNKSGLQTSKGSTGATNMAHSDQSMTCSTAPSGERLKSKFTLFSLTTSILHQHSKANTNNTDHCLANGSIPTSSDITLCNRESDLSGLYHQIRHTETNDPGRIYSMCEKVGESGTEELGKMNKNDQTSESLIINKANENEIDESSSETKEVHKVIEKRSRFSDIPCICDKDLNDECTENDEEISRL